MADFDTRKVSFRIEIDKYISIEELAAKRGVTTSEIIREFITRGLSVEATLADIDNIRSNIRAELESYLAPQVNRLVKLIVKSGITSAAGYFLNAKALAEFVPQELQVEFEQALRESKKQGVAYIQVRDTKIEDVINDVRSKLQDKL